jgi:hypothetical protein
MLSPARMTSPDRRSVPWQVGDLMLLYLTNVAGLLLIVVGWYEASGALSQDAQILWLDLGIVGVIVAGAGNVLWLLTGRRAVGELRRALTPALMARFAEPTGDSRAIDLETDSGQLVTGAEMTRYHRADCLLVAGKEVQAAAEATHRSEGRRPCQVCRSGECEIERFALKDADSADQIWADEEV